MNTVKLATRQPVADVRQYFGTVVEAGAELEVATASGNFIARRADGCLLDPGPGDRVLIASDGKEAFILTVLQVASRDGMTLAFSGDLRLKSAGKLKLDARDGIALETPGEVVLNSGELAVSSLRGKLTFDHLSVVASFVESHAERIKLIARSFDSVLERLYQTVRRSHRRVEELDDLRAGQIDYRARDLVSIHGQNAVVTGKDLVKVDAEQIHLG